MRIMAQVCMVMNLDKCIGCHTCTVITWTDGLCGRLTRSPW